MTASDLVPGVRLDALEPEPAEADPDVEDDAVEAAQRLLRHADDALAVLRVGDVGDDRRRRLADELGGLLRRRLVAVHDGDPRALDGRQHADGLAVAGRRVGVAVAQPAAPDDEHAPALQPPRDVDGPLRRRGDDRIDTVGHMAIIPVRHEDPQDDRVRAVLERLPEPKINLFTMLANAPALIGPALRLGEAILTRGDLPAELRELAILQSAQDDRDRVRVGPARGDRQARRRPRREGRGDPVRQPRRARARRGRGAAPRRADCIGTGTPDEALVREVAEHHGRNGLIELLLVAGYYAMLGGVMRAVRIDVDSVVEKG